MPEDQSHGVTLCSNSEARVFFREKLEGDIPDTATFIAFKDEHGVVGGWVFERYTGVGGAVFSHWAGRDARWLKRWMLRIAAAYVFVQLGVSRVYGECAAKDIRVRRIDERLGFIEIATLPGYFPDDDLVIYEMQLEDCKWLPQTRGYRHG